MITPQGWIPNLGPKQLEVFNCYDKYTLVTGPRWSSKTRACLHRIARHCWEVPTGRVLMMTPTVKNAVMGGVWSQFTDIVLPEWFASGIGMEYVVTPRMQGATRQFWCSVKNAHGGVTQIQLGSLDYDRDVEKILKGKEYSMIFFSELDNFKDRIVFDASIQQLRMDGVPQNNLMWLADTNPAEEGEESWLWKLWYGERMMENHPEPEFQKSLRLIETNINDNIWITEEKKREIKGSFSYDQDLLARYWFGQWKASSRNSHFHDVFKVDTHVVGVANSKNEADWEILKPQENCIDLITGWDLGGGRNHSAHIVEPIDLGGKFGFSVLDDQVSVGKMIRVEDFTEAFMEKMKTWEELIKRESGRIVRWRHWSDNSAFVFRAASDRAQSFDHLIVMRASGGKIQLRAAPKFPGSVRKRVELVRRLLFENRIWISAKCKDTITMLRMLRKGKAQTEFVADSPFRHPFDSMSYALMSELVDEIAGFEMPVASGSRGYVTTPA